MLEAVRDCQNRFALDRFCRLEDPAAARAAFESCITYQSLEAALGMRKRSGQAPAKKVKTGGKANDKKDDTSGHYGSASGRR